MDKPSPPIDAAQPAEPRAATESLSMDARSTPKWAQQMIDRLRTADPENLPETP